MISGGFVLYKGLHPRVTREAGERCALSSRSAFSLIEIIAALAIIAILTAATLPSLIKQIDYANQAMEGTNLLALATGLTQGGCSQRYIPSQADWATFIATNIGWQVGSVQTNARNNARVFLIDPTLSIGACTANTLPYQQNNSGASGNPNARFIIISSQPGPLPANLTSGVPVNPSDFNALWNNPSDTVPSGTSWSFNPNGQGADIKIQRINFASSFSHVVLTCLDFTNAVYSIDGYATNIIYPLGGKFDAHFLNGTVLNLYYWSNGSPTLQAAQIIQQDTSWFFCNGLWRNAPCHGDLPLTSMQAMVQSFFSLSLSNSLVYADMTNYMGLYLQWAKIGFPKNDPFHTLLQAATTQLNGDINNLITSPP